MNVVTLCRRFPPPLAACFLFGAIFGCPGPEGEPEPPSGAFGTSYPIFSPSHAYATARHAGESRYGTVGAIGTPLIEPVFAEGNTGRLRFRFDFNTTDDTFAGIYFSFGRTAVDVVNSDGTNAGALSLENDSTANMRDFVLTGDVAIEYLRIALGSVQAATPITLRIELTDGNGERDFIRTDIGSGGHYSFALSGFTGVDLSNLKLLSLVVEELHVGDKIANPVQGSFEIDSICLSDEDGKPFDAGSIAKLGDTAMLEEIARRDFESLYRLRDAKTGMCLDRTLFRDLIHIAPTGWLLAALPAAVGRGWISEADAGEAALKILRHLDQSGLWGNAPSGMVGNSTGVMYRFLGLDPTDVYGELTGTRKIDVGNVNAVEASVIDTAIFQFGAATCAAGLGDRFPEIQSHVESLLTRTSWGDLVDPGTGQLYLSWKPESGEGFTAPSASGGYWASRADGTPLTIDYWTDEGGLASILAAGQDPALASTWYAMERVSRDGAVVTYPGSWFTYTFLSATYLPTDLGSDEGAAWGTVSIDWIANARAILNRYSAALGDGILPDAVELPNNAYLAQGLPIASVDPTSQWLGVRTPYSLELAVGLGGDTATAAIAELRTLLQRYPSLWDPCYGFLDSFHPNLADFSPPENLPHAAELVRTGGLWVQQQVWSLNKGAALLALLNRIDSDTIRNTAREYPQIANGLNAIYRVAK